MDPATGNHQPAQRPVPPPPGSVANIAQSIGPLPGSFEARVPLTIRNSIRQILHASPTNTLEEAIAAYVHTDKSENVDNTEAAVKYLEDPKRVENRSPAQQVNAFNANPMVMPDVKEQTKELKRKYQNASIQQCYLAVKLAEKGDFEDSERSLKMLVGDRLNRLESSGGAK